MLLIQVVNRFDLIQNVVVIRTGRCWRQKGSNATNNVVIKITIQFAQVFLLLGVLSISCCVSKISRCDQQFSRLVIVEVANTQITCGR